jgi:hypothetical protein
MPRLETALVTLSRVVGVPTHDLAEALLSFDDATFADHPQEDASIVMPESVLAECGIRLASVGLRDAHYFHGTRVRDPETFRKRGILPLGRIVDEIWEMMYDLVRTDCGEDEWASFRRNIESDGCGHDGFLYRMKTKDRFHWGLNSCLVREALLRPPSGTHDYIGCPEIVQDIARCYGHGLETKFRAGTVGCIVEYRGAISSPKSAVTAACWFLLGKLRDDDDMPLDVTWGPDRQGVAVPPEAIRGVELIRESR